jgi:D-threo-aldose 1-dehydrogenase
MIETGCCGAQERALLPAAGLGTAPLGGLYTEVALDDAVATVQAAVDAGCRYFDTAPLYGYGAAERALGIALADDVGDVAVSTKVGRRIDEDAPAAPDDMFAIAAGTASWDFSADGVRRSLQASLERLGRCFVDVVYIHDPDQHARQALDEAYPALERLRSEGMIGAIGVGMNEPTLPTRFVVETDIDAVLIAGRYTLLDRSAQPELFAATDAHGVHVVAAGVYNSGILTGAEQEPHFDYAAAPGRILERANKLRAVCEAHGVSLAAAAVRFVVQCDSVDTVVVGARSPAEAAQNWSRLHRELPEELWPALEEALRDEGG